MPIKIHAPDSTNFEFFYAFNMFQPFYLYVSAERNSETESQTGNSGSEDNAAGKESGKANTVSSSVPMANGAQSTASSPAPTSSTSNTPAANGRASTPSSDQPTGLAKENTTASKENRLSVNKGTGATGNVAVTTTGGGSSTGVKKPVTKKARHR